MEIDTAFSSRNFGRAFANSLGVAVATAALVTTLTAMMAYAFARFEFAGKAVIYYTVLAMMMVPTMMLIIPQFIVAKRLGLLNSLPGLVWPGVPLTLETLSQNPVALDLFDETNQWEAEHIALADRADLLLVAPATANIISKAACGIADDLVSTALLTMMADIPIVMAPAMNNRMWENPIIVRHVAALAELGVVFVGPAEGVLADGKTGIGRMADESDIIDAVISRMT